MSRNSEVLFSNLPQANIPRSIFDIPQDIKTTFDVGQLIPFYVNECLPASSVKIQTNKVVRLQTLLTPLMDQLVLDTMYFFCPSRILWTHWKEFMGEDTTSAYLPPVEYQIPAINIGNGNGAVDTGSILDYMGVPLVADTDNGAAINALPYRAYCLIWNEFFRDENLQDPVNINLGDSNLNWEDATPSNPLPVNRLHDYFSSALKAPAKNADGFVTAWVNAASSTRAPNGMLPVVTGSSTILPSSGSFPSLSVSSLNGGTTYRVENSSGFIASSNGGTADKFINSLDITSGSGNFYPSNLYAKVTSDGNAIGITIPSLRQAFQMQKFLERDASHGTRYQEQLLSHFGVRAQDARLQRPEYLGGNRIPLNVSQIINQAQSSGEFLGDVGGMSLTTDSHYDVEYSTTEHGYLLGVMCVRYKASYSQGIEKFWSKRTKFQFAFPEFAHLTDQEIRMYELYMFGEHHSDVFGYAERYAEYKFKPNKVCGEMRPGISNSLSSWHLGDYYTEEPYLSDGWLQVSKSNVDRALAVTSAVSNQLFADILVNARWTLPLPAHSNPGFADHF